MRDQKKKKKKKRKKKEKKRRRNKHKSSIGGVADAGQKSRSINADVGGVATGEATGTAAPAAAPPAPPAPPPAPEKVTAAAAAAAETGETTAANFGGEILQLAQPTLVATVLTETSFEAAPEASLSQLLGTTKGPSLAEILAAPRTQVPTPPTQVSVSPSPTPVFCPVHSVITLDELVVKESNQEPDPVFGVLPKLGLGLFLPTERQDRPLSTKVITEDLLLRGPGVARVRVEDMATWQKPYSMTDLRNKAYVYVPADKTISCKLFRFQHSRHPTHTAVQEDHDDVPRFVYNKPMDPGQ
jgi:hypothetical protein